VKTMQPYRRRYEEHSQKGDVTQEVIERISALKSLSELKPEDFAPEGKYAEKIAQQVKQNLKTNQLRNFFDEIRAIEKNLKRESWSEAKNRLLLLTPKLAYAAGRTSSGKPLIPGEFFKLMSACISKTNSPEDFKTFVNFLESIVAYHKYYGGE